MAKTIFDIAQAKRRDEKIVMITCYDYSSAALVSRAGLDFILVGDSLGQVMLGHNDTPAVTLDNIVHHARAVVRGAPDALVVGDLPFMTYGSIEAASAAGQRLVQEGGVRAVKLEGGKRVAPIVEHLANQGLPVMGHLGFTPQAAHQIGVKVQARSLDGAAELIADAQALEAAGAFAIVLELVPGDLAAAVTASISVPTIGIGAGAGCSGQVQIWHDILGLGGETTYRHAKRYAEVGASIVEALQKYADEVKTGAFPTAANTSVIDPAILAQAISLGRSGGSSV